MSKGAFATSTVSLAKINSHRNYGKVFAFTHSNEKCRRNFVKESLLNFLCCFVHTDYENSANFARANVFVRVNKRLYICCPIVIFCFEGLAKAECVGRFQHLHKCQQDNHYARFHLHIYHCCREMNFISRLDVNFLDSTQSIDKVGGAWKWRSRAPGQSACFKKCVEGNYSARFHLHSYHCFIFTATTAAEKWTLFLDSTQNIDKVSGAWNEGQGHRSRCLLEECLKDNCYARFHPHS